jgi:hypothetical protein
MATPLCSWRHLIYPVKELKRRSSRFNRRPQLVIIMGGRLAQGA